MTRLLYERRFGIQTAERVELESLGLAEQDRWHYEPAEWRVLSRVLKPGEITPEDVFVDIGSGMGRVVIRAAQHDCRRVIGVELSKELTEVARKNVERMEPQLKCQDVELITSDALSYRLPDDASIVFFNNPFTGEIFSRVINGIVASLDQSPRRMRIVYRNPIEHDTVLATGRFELVREWQRSQHSRKNAGVKIHLYETVADGGAQGSSASSRLP